ncbi:MAG TPA: hypothetical protein VN873_12715 [Candidatus Angelobacter sp.]|nr:hypothetical protein [Candidatus Angelobacter sp.]
MRLFEAIIDANHRAVAGDAQAGVRVADFKKELPVVALTCVDPRLNVLFPTGPLSSTMRSLALSCAVKGGKEMAILGHTDCQEGSKSKSTNDYDAW